MKVQLLGNVSSKDMQGDIYSYLAYFVHISNISNTVNHKKN